MNEKIKKTKDILWELDKNYNQSIPDTQQNINEATEKIVKLFAIPDVVKSLPTEQCVRDWWREGTGDEHFWKHETDWSNEQVFREIYQALTYFINRWQ